MIKTFLVFLSFVFLAACTPCKVATTTSVSQQIVPLVHSYALTTEGWWVIFTNNQAEVADLCEMPRTANILGCSRWPDTVPEGTPSQHCLVMVYTGDATESTEATVQHELRHCQEGHWHAQEGINK